MRLDIGSQKRSLPLSLIGADEYDFAARGSISSQFIRGEPTWPFDKKFELSSPRELRPRLSDDFPQWLFQNMTAWLN
jgi:hypothetical protein